MEKLVTLQPLHRAALIQPDTFDAKARTVEVIWTTGAGVRRYNRAEDEYYIERLEVSASAVDLSRLNSGAAPVVDSHRAEGLSSQIGVVVRAWVTPGFGHALLRLSQREDLAGLIGDIQNGIIRNISVGYSVERFEVTREQGKDADYLATRWMPQELSFVVIPADAGATTRAHPNTPEQGGTPCLMVTREVDDMAATQNDTAAQVAAQPDAATVAQRAAPEQDAAALRAAAEQETTTQRAAQEATRQADAANAAERSAEIVELAQRHGMSERAGEWIRAGKTVDQVRAEVLTALEKRDSQNGGSFNRFSAGTDETERRRGAAVEVLLSRARVPDADGKMVQIARENPFRSHTLLELARDCLARGGVRTEGLNKLELVGRAFTQGTSDFPVLLETAMHKTMLGSYAVASYTWSRFCARGSVSDFRAHGRYRVGSFGNLDALTELNEFRTKNIPDGKKSSIEAGTKGNIINLSRKAIINDDLGAFIGLAAAYARAAGRTVESDVYAYLNSNPVIDDGTALFHADHKNLSSAAGVTVESIEAARVLMAAQKDISDNDFLDLRPGIWVGGLALGGTARVVNDAEFDPDANNKLNRPNKVRGLFSDVIDSPRITTTDWYLFADPNDAPVIEVAFLDGEDTPFLDMEQGFTVDGARWKVRLDFGVKAIDHVGAVKTPAA